MLTKKYRIIIAGSRDFTDYERVKKSISHLTKEMEHDEIEIVSGACDVPGILTYTTTGGTKVYGADGLGERLAKEKEWSVKIFPANWSGLGKAAGPIRNEQMAQYATHALIFWDGNSRGTKSMIDLALKHGLIITSLLFNNDKKVQVCDATKAPSMEEVLAQKETLQEENKRLKEVLDYNERAHLAMKKADNSY